MRTHTACIQIEYTHKEWGEEGEGWVWGGGRERDSVRAIERERERARARQRDLGVVGVLHHAEEVVVDQDLPTV